VSLANYITAHHPQVLGSVRNLPTGEVESVFQGELSQVQSLIKWCEQGPKWAVVDSVKIENDQPDPSLVKFEILR